MIGRLGYGELRTRKGATTRRYFVDGGFAQIRDDVITVVTNCATPAADVDPSAATSRYSPRPNCSAPTTDLEHEEKDKAVARGGLR